MSINKARNHYLGKEGYERMNCAQSVISAFKDKFNLSAETVELFKACGGGRAPEGLCGAFYAAKYIMGKNNAEKISADLENYFLDQAGSVKCHEIRRCRKMSCVDCVEKSCEYLEKIG
ncbi:C-GCAxxG-C-C family protein [Pseudobacteroides cellulosolvens]|uniref:C_GCAxxG_C_C family protein n=1 Tax=Pseudobacteroides cellulosolvens ATCC 35603 = DSM 2933 TaxID=398512 RepID=A0A0L6JK52_9FIRM|nr:C-GCAxxG-C-C family protein [Pseudobacteroides cellulosolvens]KNY26093.1 C_GCAxxG_C_C family protein [Pseudobacteroides cellulosolvens ATCC 35603 = DSM 2933]